MAPNRMFQQLTDKTKKKKKHRPFYEAVDAHARRRLKKKHRPFYEAVDAHARRRLTRSMEVVHRGVATTCARGHGRNTELWM